MASGAKYTATVESVSRVLPPIIPSMVPHLDPLPGHSGHHAVQFYEDSSRLCVAVADFLGDGIAAQQPVIIIATPAHRNALLAELKRRHFDVDQLLADQKMALMDAAATLAMFMEDGMPNPSRFRVAIGTVIKTVCGDRPDCVARAYGEMVDILWRDGQCDAAIRLEVLWNELANQYSFSLLCGYGVGNFYKQPGAMTRICAHHTHTQMADAQSSSTS